MTSSANLIVQVQDCQTLAPSSWTMVPLREKERNAKDGLYKRIGADGQKLVTVPFKKMRGVATGELTARWDIVIGLIPED